MVWLIPFFYLSFILLSVVVVFYAERKIASFIQDRLGPTHTGKWGMLQPIADLIKLLQKEDIIPARADRSLFVLAPYLVFGSVFMGFSFIPLSFGLAAITSQSAIVLVLAVISLDIIGLLLAGWASNNKYALLGAMRSAAQIVSYEVPLGLSIFCALIISGSLDLIEINQTQAGENKAILSSGFLSWNVSKAPFLLIAWVIFFISSLAQCNRAPFDIPEAESELVAGFHVEYSGFRFSIFFLAEYAMMCLMSLLGALLFFGGWNSPFPNIGPVLLFDYTSGKGQGIWAAHLWNAFWLISKMLFFVFLQIWIRWTLPRVRVDQLMYICWKVLTPAALLLVFMSVFWKMLVL